MQIKLLRWLMKGLSGLIGHLQQWKQEFGTIPDDIAKEITDCAVKMRNLL